MKKNTVIVVMAFVSVFASGAVFAQDGQKVRRQALETSLGYVSPAALHGLSLGVGYTYSQWNHIDLLARVEMMNGYKDQPASHAEDHVSVNALLVGVRYNVKPATSVWNCGLSLIGGPVMNWRYDAALAVANNGLPGSIWTGELLGGGQVDCMYRLSSTAALGVYGNVLYNFSRNPNPWFGAGLKLSVQL